MEKKERRERKTRYVPVRMTATQGQHLDELARRENVNASEVMRRLIEQAARGAICAQ